MQALDQYKIRRPPIALKQTRFTKEKKKKQETEGQMRDSWFFIFHDSQEEMMVVAMMRVLGWGVETGDFFLKKSSIS